MHEQRAGTPGRSWWFRSRPYWAPLALAFTLALLPLPLTHSLARASAPASGPEGGMGAPVLVMVEGGARLPAPATGVLLVLPNALVAARRVQLRPLQTRSRPASTLPRRARLVALGRLELEGG